MPITFKDAAAIRMPFGKYKGKTLDEIASSDEGLKYLDWLRGRDTYGQLGLALGVYLDDAAIKKDLEGLRT